MRRNWRTAAAVVAAALGSMSSAACGMLDPPGKPVDLPAPPPATVHDSWPGCLKIGAFAGFATPPPDLGSGSVPADFATRAVIVCAAVEDASPSPDQRVPETGYERRGTNPTDIQAVIDYLALPSQKLDDWGNTACDARAEILPWLFLLDSHGRWVQPALPKDWCGRSRAPTSGPMPYVAMRSADIPVCRVDVTSEQWRCVP